MKIKESDKKDNYLNLTRELRMFKNMLVTVIPNVIGTLGTVPKGSESGLRELEIKERIETIQIKHFKDQPEYSEDIGRPGETCCHLDFSERPSAKVSVKLLLLLLI